MRLTRLVMSNFKGVRDLVVDLLHEPIEALFTGQQQAVHARQVLVGLVVDAQGDAVRRDP